MDEKPLDNTPLHEAAASGKTHFAVALATLKPSLARKLNPEGFSPMHLALQSGHILTARALMNIDADLVRVKGRNKITPLHYAAEKGEDEILAEFLCACPSAIEDLTNRFETAVHIAVNNQHLKVFKVLLGWLRRVSMEDILQWKDEDGNTVLHVATLTNQPKVIEELINQGNVNVNAKNSGNKTALDVFVEQSLNNKELEKIFRRAGAKRSPSPLHVITLADYLTQKLNFLERLDRDLGVNNAITPGKSHIDIRNTILVIAILIATATYQALLSPPGGYWQDDNTNPADVTTFEPTVWTIVSQEAHRAGQMAMSGEALVPFLVTNSLAFLLSVITILTMIVGLPCTRLLILSIGFLMINYFSSVGDSIPGDFGRLGGIFIGSLLFIIVVVCYGTSMVTRKSDHLKQRIETPRRRVGDFLNTI